jgi:hypothetical protein
MRTAAPAAQGGGMPLLGRRIRKTTLVVHLVSAGTWIGIDVLVAVLVAVGWWSDDPQHRATAYQALGWFVVWPMFTTAMVCLATGLLLGLGTKWGLLRYWWVAVKLVLNLVLSTLILVALRPGMPDVVRHGQDLAAGVPSDVDVSFLFFPPAVSLAALTLATVLAVFKPWGRIGGTLSYRRGAVRGEDGRRSSGPLEPREN